MKTWIAVIAAGLALSGPVAMDPAAAANLITGVHATDPSKATDVGARRRARLHRYVARRASYYDRPNYYRPYPYAVPVPFFLGFGFGPSW